MEIPVEPRKDRVRVPLPTFILDGSALIEDLAEFPSRMQSSCDEVTALDDVGHRALVDRKGFRFFKEFSSSRKGSSPGIFGGSTEVIGAGQPLQ